MSEGKIIAIEGGDITKKSLDLILTDLAFYGAELRQFVESTQAHVSDYKFDIEKNDGKVLIGFVFKGSLKQKSGSFFPLDQFEAQDRRTGDCEKALCFPLIP